MENGGGEQLLSSVHGGDPLHGEVNSPLLPRKQGNSRDEKDDIQPINGVADFAREFFNESKKLWYLAGPAIFTSFCMYGLITISQIFAGHLGTIQLAALSVENNIISAFPYAMMLGMSSALETYCGQAFGANQFKLLGIYMQKTWLILNALAFAAIPLFVFATPVLKFLGQTASISREAGKFALWMIPQQFAYALMFPTTKFLQAQSKVMVIAVIAAVALCLHAFFSWFLIMYLGWGLIGAGLVLDASWWFMAIAQFLYIVAGSCGEAWSGFSWKAFQDLWRFVKISVASAVMMCLELWYLMAMTLFAGYLEDAEISIDALSICVNILGWACTVALGLNVASSVRVSNELGSMHPRKSRFSALASGVTSLLVGLFFTLILIISRRQYPAIMEDGGGAAAQRLSTIYSDDGLNSEENSPLAGPAIFTSFCQYGLFTVTQIFAGHLGTTQLAALSMENSIISGFPYGMMFQMLGIYMQKTWVILNAIAFAAIPLFIFATPVLKFLGQTALVSTEAGKFALWMIPEQFAYAMVFPSTKFLQAQSKVIVIAAIAAVAFCLHGFFSWLLITNLGWGLVGAALVLDASWWFIAIAQFLYIVAGAQMVSTFSLENVMLMILVTPLIIIKTASDEIFSISKPF